MKNDLSFPFWSHLVIANVYFAADNTWVGAFWLAIAAAVWLLDHYTR